MNILIKDELTGANGVVAKSNNKSSVRTFRVDAEAFMKALYANRGLSQSRQKTLVGELDISRGTDHKLRTGKAVSKGIIFKVAYALGVEPASLVETSDRQRFLDGTIDSSEQARPETAKQSTSFPVADAAEQADAEIDGQWQLTLPTACQTDYFVRDDDLVHIKELMRLGGDPEKVPDFAAWISRHWKV